MKKILKVALALIERLLGISISVKKRNAKSSYVLVDKFLFSPFLKKEKESILYNEAIKKSDSLWSDNFYKELRFYSLTQIAQIASSQFDGFNIAECGVWRGHSAYLISSIFKKNKFKGKFYIFDSFEGGLSDRNKIDKNLIKTMSSKDKEQEKKLFSSTLTHVSNVLKEFNFIKFFPGWIPDRFDEIANKKFSFVHIDVDLYEPTISSLNFFWPRLIKGGFIIVDDYNSSLFDGATLATNSFLRKNKPTFFYKVPMGSCIIIK